MSRWSNKIIVDNFSPFQRVAIECLEDCRVDRLTMRRYPGLYTLFMSLHPQPEEDACNQEEESCIRHRLAMLSYACMNPQHSYQNKDIIEFAERFYDAIKEGEESSLKDVSSIAISFIARTRRQSDQLPKVHFKDTEIDYRDDNRHLWIYIEDGDDEEIFEQASKKKDDDEIESLPPRHYPEWDYNAKNYRPDWVSLYESLHPSTNPAKIISTDKGTLGKGSQADVTIIDPQAEYTVDVNKFKSKSKNCPYNGWHLQGKVDYTIVGGEIRYSAS